MSTSKKKVLFLSPRAAIWVHAFPEAVLAESLMKSGHDVCYVTCGEVLKNHCEAMDANSAPHGSSLEVRSRVCALCHFQGELLRTNMALPGCRLSDVITEADVTWANEMLEACPKEGVENYFVDGMPVGRTALYVLLLDTKRIDLHFSAEEMAIYRIELFNTLLGLAAAKKLVAQEKPERVIIYNALYPVNQIFLHYVESQGIPCYSLHAGANLAHRIQYIFLTRRYTFDFFAQQIADWPRWSGIPAGGDEISQTVDHFLTLIQGIGHWAYSSARNKDVGDLRERFGVPGGASVLVATMSSYDERFAAEAVHALPDYSGRLLFDRQADWVQAVIEYVADRPDLFFIIRVHPREFRGNVSQHAAKLKQLFATLPANVRVNWPTDEISIFDLAEITDVFLNAWSSAGKEMALLGIPAVIYSKELVFYPPELNYVGDESREHYFAAIESALADGWRAERIVQAFRWYAFDHHRSLFDLRQSYPLPQHTPIGVYGRHKLSSIAHAAEARLDVYQRADRLRQADLLSDVVEQGADSLLPLLDPEAFRLTTEAEELALIKTHMRRLLQTWHGERVPTSLTGLFVRLYAFANSP
ncbi:MAG: capsule biosynthesis protein [Deltaproteobacteria bacterium]|nr:capsule biosynthesis protein [Deltaproteobacteria bacterium]